MHDNWDQALDLHHITGQDWRPGPSILLVACLQALLSLSYTAETPRGGGGAGLSPQCRAALLPKETGIAFFLFFDPLSLFFLTPSPLFPDPPPYGTGSDKDVIIVVVAAWHACARQVARPVRRVARACAPRGALSPASYSNTYKA